MIDRADVLALFSSQFWVADIAQLKDAGVSARARSPGLAQRGHDRRRAARRSSASAGSPETFESRAMALQLHAGEPGVPERRHAPARCTACARCRGRSSRSPCPRTSAAGHAGVGSADRRRAGSTPTATSSIRPDGLRVATPAADAVPPGPDVQRPPLRAGRRGRLAPRSRHPEPTPPTTWRRSAASGKWGVTRLRALAGEDGRCAPGRARAASSSTSSTRCAAPACPNPSASIR